MASTQDLKRRVRSITNTRKLTKAMELVASARLRRAQARIVLIGMDFESSLRLPSWDGFYLPRPFSRAHMRFVAVGPGELADRDAGTRMLGERLSALNPDRRTAPVRKRG